MDRYIAMAKELGFSKAVALDGLKLSCDPSLRALCNPQQCPSHGNNWVCPPGCGSLEACAASVNKFSQGFLVQSVSDMLNNEGYRELNRAHNLRLRSLVDEMEREYAELLPLTSGGCIFCESCAYPAECIYPRKRMQSLSAYGINVGELCKVAGLNFEFRRDKVFFVACVLF